MHDDYNTVVHEWLFCYIFEFVHGTVYRITGKFGGIVLIWRFSEFDHDRQIKVFQRTQRQCCSSHAWDAKYMHSRFSMPLHHWIVSYIYSVFPAVQYTCICIIIIEQAVIPSISLAGAQQTRGYHDVSWSSPPLCSHWYHGPPTPHSLDQGHGRLYELLSQQQLENCYACMYVRDIYKFNWDHAWLKDAASFSINNIECAWECSFIS